MSEDHTLIDTGPGRDPAAWPTMREAGELLGLSPNAIRQRIRRGSLIGEKVDGVWRVQVPWVAATGAGQGPRTGPEPPPYDQGATAGDTATPTAGQPGQVELVAELRSERDYLREQLATRDREIERRDVIILRLTESLKALPAPREEPAQAAPVVASPAASRDRLQHQVWDWFKAVGTVYESLVALVFVVGLVAIASQREELGVVLYGLYWVLIFVTSAVVHMILLAWGTRTNRRRLNPVNQKAAMRRVGIVALTTAVMIPAGAAILLSFSVEASDLLAWYVIVPYLATSPVWIYVGRWIEGRKIRGRIRFR